ncbi:MAG: hypothetical protein K2W95_28300 [Candidatus Obscuribacterales bacterium]|nr:hypothetical protein [Candidatus Obscuribacterales bacterium]
MATKQINKLNRQVRVAASGQSIIEAVVGIVLLVFLTLALLDVATLIICKFACDGLATKAARVAADHELSDEITPKKAAIDAVKRFPKSNIITFAKIEDEPKPVEVDEQSDHLAVRVSIDVRIPFTVPFLPDTVRFTSESIQPWIAKPGNQ